ncbi:MAG: hypothetical protein HYY61_02340 [Deltaproteobacteria bacterium]|nr:hypothetical protein [Deltaproteobacteria bacterium]
MKLMIPFFLAFIFGLSAVMAQKTVGNYTVDTWYTSQTDSTVQFKLAQNPNENCVMYVMETTLDSLPQKVLVPIADYAQYTSMFMPRMYKSQVLHHTNQSSLNFVMGKQRKFGVSVSQAETDIVQFSLNLPWLPDNHYTLLLSTFQDPQTEIIHVYWIQYDEKNYKNISGSWLLEVPSPTTKNFWGSSVFDTKTYPNSNEDIYGSWTLTPLANNKTFVHYENYVDPGWMGRQVIDDVVKSTLEDMPKIISVIRTNVPRD